MHWKTVISLTGIVLLYSHYGLAQSVLASGATGTSTPGTGEDYIHALSETVDPASGQVSLRLAFPVPPSRGVTVPFSVAYDSGALYYAGQTYGSPANSASITLYNNSSPLQQNGWSYTVPNVTFNFTTRQVPNSGKQPNPFPCPQFSGYLFSDPSGGTHNLDMGVTSPAAQNPGTPCYGVVGRQYPTGSDDVVTASIQTSPQTNPGAIMVHEPNGTTYFATASSIYDETAGPPYPDESWLAIASKIEDTNGNEETIAAPQGGGGPISYIDSLGRTALSTSGFGSTGNTISVSGLANPYTFTWSNQSPTGFVATSTLVGSAPPYPYVCNGVSYRQNPSPVVTAIELPNGQSYKFSYDTGTGAVNKITYPNGGYVEYSWGTDPQSGFAIVYPSSSVSISCEYIYDRPAILHRYVSFDGKTIALQQDFTYTTNWSGNFWSTKQTTVATTVFTPQGGKSVYTTTYTYDGVNVTNIAPGYASGTGMQPGVLINMTADSEVPIEATAVYQDSTGKTLKTVNKTWASIHDLASETTTLDNGLTNEVAYSYGPGSQVTQKSEYDYGSGSPGALLRKTITNYQSFPVTPLYPAASIWSRPCQEIVYDGSGNRMAETDTFYDNGSTNSICGPPGVPSVSSVSNISGHDETNYSASSTSPRGNRTTIIQQCFAGAKLCSNPTSSYTYDEAGQKLKATDARSNATYYSYLDSYSDSTPSEPTDAQITQITYPPTNGVSHIVNYSYDYSDSKLSVSKDENGNPTYYSYNDSMRRLTETDFADGGVTKNIYADTPLQVNVETESKIDPAGTEWTNTYVLYDGMGHAIAQNKANGESTPWDRVDTCFDGNGRVVFSSYPYQAAGALTSPNCNGTGDVSNYDALNRVVSITHSDGTIATTNYSGRATDVLDEGNGTRSTERVTQVDGLGRLVSACEVSGSSQSGLGGTPAACGQDINKTGFLTIYNYNTLGDMLSVNQGSVNQRTFTYNSLSQLLCAANPEVGGTATCPNPDSGSYTPGTTRYGYDLDANVVQRIRPAPNQSSSSTTVTATYSYDALNRLISTTYGDGTNGVISQADSTPSVNLSYDQSSLWGETTQNTIGRLTQTQTTNGSGIVLSGSVFSYDQMGRTINSWQCTPLNCGGTPASFTYTYDRLGNLTSSYNNADGIAFSDVLDSEARLTAVESTLNDSQHPGTLISFRNFNSFGKPLNVTYGNGINDTISYTVRGWLYSVSSSAQPPPAGYALSIENGSSFGFAPNGDVLYSADSVNGDWTYQYDDFNRVIQATCSANCPPTGGVQYTYDRYGNRWKESVTAGSGIQPSFSFDANNHITGNGVTYDAAGNIWTDSLGNSYNYDAENRIVSLSGINSASYVYDARGRRVRAIVGSQTKDFLLDLSGRTIDEFTPGPGGWLGTWTRGEVYAGSIHIATYANSTTTFEQDDWISTARVRSNVSGSIVETCSSLPFGEDMTCSGTDVSPLHFTGKERDSESGNDYFGARYYSSTMARFITPDWDAKPASVPYASFGDPQTLNLYAYVSNQPLNRVDEDGHVWCSDFYKDCITDAQYDILKETHDGSCGWCHYTKHMDDDKALGLSEAQAELLAKQFTAIEFSGLVSNRDRTYLERYLAPVTARAAKYGVDPALPLGLGGESGFADTSIKNNMYNWTGDAFGMTGGSTKNPAKATSPEDDVNQLFANWGDQMQGAGSDTLQFLHGLEQEDANGNQLTGPPDSNGNRSNLGHIYNSKDMPPTDWMQEATGWINQMKRDLSINSSQ